MSTYLDMRLLVAVVALLVVVSPGQACSVRSISVGDNLNQLETPLLDDDMYRRYGSDQVAAHFENQDDFLFASVTDSTYSCVDSRGITPQLGTPGGDLAEMVAGMMAWFKVKNKSVNHPDIRTFFNTFFDKIVTDKRPLYFHTDDERLRSMYEYLGNRGVRVDGLPPAVLPERAPRNTDLRNKWLDALVKPEFQGCGHIRLMLDPETAAFYSVPRSGPANRNCTSLTTDCLDASKVASKMIRLFYSKWWPTREMSLERQKTRWVVDVGPLLGKAVAAISQDRTGSCSTVAPLFEPNYAGSTVFVYHGDAVQLFRRSVTRRLAADLQVDAGQWESTWNDIATLQLGATLANLAPASEVGLFPVTVETQA